MHTDEPVPIDQVAQELLHHLEHIALSLLAAIETEAETIENQDRREKMLRDYEALCRLAKTLTYEGHCRLPPILPKRAA